MKDDIKCVVDMTRYASYCADVHYLSIYVYGYRARERERGIERTDGKKEGGTGPSPFQGAV